MNANHDDYEQSDEYRQTLALVGSAALAKACYDEYYYAVRLRTGEVITFKSAKVLNRDWVHLDILPVDDQPEANRIAFTNTERGVDVRLDDIVWVEDAPHKGQP